LSYPSSFLGNLSGDIWSRPLSITDKEQSEVYKTDQNRVSDSTFDIVQLAGELL